jgi:hypothetical protein
MRFSHRPVVAFQSRTVLSYESFSNCKSRSILYKRMVSKYTSLKNDAPYLESALDIRLTSLSLLKAPLISLSISCIYVISTDPLSTVPTYPQNRIRGVGVLDSDRYIFRIYEYNSAIRFPKFILIREKQVRINVVSISMRLEKDKIRK